MRDPIGSLNAEDDSNYLDQSALQIPGNSSNFSGGNEELNNRQNDEETENDDDSDEDDDDDDDDDDEDDDDDDETEIEESDDESDAEKSNLDQCPLSPNSTPTCYICLNNFEGQDIGVPDSCENMHHFCLECIEEWSKQVNTCPVDRKTFSFIIVRREINGEIVMKVPIAKKSVIEIVTLDDFTYCEICGRCDREDRLLLCDGCDFGYHCECLTPPLETIPIDEWFCPECFEIFFPREVQEEIDNNRPIGQGRVIARTGAFERVRNRILARRSNTTSTTVANRTVNPTRRKRKRTKKRKTKTTKKRKTSKTTKKTKTGKTKTRRKYKKRTKKSKFSMKRLPAADPRSRLATRLGLGCKPKTPFSIPATKPTNNNRSLAEDRYSAGISSLSLFGYELEMSQLRSYDDDNSHDVDSNASLGLLTSSRRVFPLVNSKAIQPPEPLLQINSTDVLSEIMNSQEILHASSSDLSIARDGRLYLKSDAKNIRQCPNSSNASPSSPSSSNGHNNTNNNSNNNTTSNNNNSNHSNNNNQNYTYSRNSSYSQENTQDISFIKPLPVSLIEDKNDIELYSDIESVGDNKDLDDNEENRKNKKDNNNDSDHLDIKNNNNNNKINNNNNNNEKSNDSISGAKKASIIKRRPSINDLFGGDSDDEDEDGDDELKRLVATKGSINTHFPIKMPIVWKNDFLTNKNKTIEESDEVPISKKWVPIYPEAPKAKNNSNSGSKWKAIGEEQSKVNETKINDKKKIDINKKEINEMENKLNKENDNDKERVGNSAKAKIADEKEKPQIKKFDKTDLTINDGQGNKNENKIRTCKHGRLINKNKKTITTETKLESEGKNLKVDIDFKKSKMKKLKKDEDCKKRRTSKERNKERSEIKSDENRYKSERKTEYLSKRSDESRDCKQKRKTDDLYDKYLKYYKVESTSSTTSLTYKMNKSTKKEISGSDKKLNENNRKDIYSIGSSKTETNAKNNTKHHHHRHHHHHHHRHHHKHKHNLDRSTDDHSVSAKNDKQSDKIKSNFQSYPMHILDSKEIYSKGDKIIVNVNFKKDDTLNQKQNKNNNNNNNDDETVMKKPKSENLKNEIVKSPELNDELTKKSDTSIESPNENEFENLNNKLKALTSNEIKSVLSDELKFLPRMMPNINDNICHESKTSVDLFLDDDSFLPTPTQDESQSPILSIGQSKLNHVIDEIDDTKDDFYDPELPLQSPDRDSLKSPKDKMFELSSLKSYSMSRDDNPSSAESSFSLSMETATKIASLNSKNFSEILQFSNSMDDKVNVHGKMFGNKSPVPPADKSDVTENIDIRDIVDMEVDPPAQNNTKSNCNSENYSSLDHVKEIWNQIMKTNQKNNNGTLESTKRKKTKDFLEKQPTSAADMDIQEKYLKKLNRQIRVVEEVKLALKPHYQKRKINKQEYKDILRKAVPKICHSKSGEINPSKIIKLVQAYIKHYRHLRNK